jgi:hypothetical protein
MTTPHIPALVLVQLQLSLLSGASALSVSSTHFRASGATCSNYASRNRMYVARLQCFEQRDPLWVSGSPPHAPTRAPIRSGAYVYAPSNPLIATDPAGTCCKIRWRNHEILLWGAHIGKYHIGLDIISECGQTEAGPLDHLDYGWSADGNWLCCKTLVKWDARPNEGNPPGVGVEFGGTSGTVYLNLPSDCMCTCLKSQTPMQYGCKCGYSLFGVPPYANSNGALHAAIEQCERRCGEGELSRPPWLNDSTFPGWDNQPRPCPHPK